MTILHEVVSVTACGTSNDPGDVTLAGLLVKAEAGDLVGDNRPVPRSLADEVRPADLDYDTASQRVGEWMAVARGDRPNGPVTAIFADPLGFHPIFWTVQPAPDGTRTLYAARTFQAMLAALRAAGVSLTIDWAVALPHLVGRRGLFTQPWCENTVLTGVRLLRPDELLLASSAGVGPVRRPFFADPKGRSYSQLMDDGIQRAVTHVEQLAAMDGERRIRLSGGRDSRGCLAILVAAGAQRHFEVRTADPATQVSAKRASFRQDLSLADRMRRRYDMSWAQSTRSGQSLPVTWEQSLADHQRFGSHREAWFQPRSRLPVDPPLRVSVRGGGGELMRDYWEEQLGKFDVANQLAALGNDVFASSELLYNTFVPRDVIPDRIHQGGRQLFTDSFLAADRHDFAQALSRQYPLYRNRYHFGHAIEHRMRNTRVWHALAYPEFLFAAEVAGLERKRTGWVNFDLVRRACPELASLQLHTGDWNGFWQEDPALKRPRWTGPPRPDLTSYPRAPRGVKNTGRSSRLFARALDRVRDNLLLVSNASDEGADMLPPELQSWVLETLRTRDLAMRSVVPKTETLAEIVTGSPVHVLIPYDCRPAPRPANTPKAAPRSELQPTP
ncbi:MAG: hypothetical protein WBG36_05775 [Ornithinimicrobium sp.]